MCVDENQVCRFMHASSFPLKTSSRYVPRQDEKNQNFPQPVVGGNSYNKTGKNYVILSAVGQSPVEDWNSNEIVIPAK